MPLSQKIGAIFLMILVGAPGILFSLFQLTCLVTGAGFRNQRWWCSAYAWVITVLLIIYSVLLIVIAILSLSSGSKILDDLSGHVIENFEDSMQSANFIAETYTSAPSASSQITNEESSSGLGNSSSSFDNDNNSYNTTLPTRDFQQFVDGPKPTQAEMASLVSPNYLQENFNTLGEVSTPSNYPDMPTQLVSYDSYESSAPSFN
jgi:hypothetical protein